MANGRDISSATLRAILTLLSRTFFSKISIFGTECVPPSGGVIFAANHQNSLLDPLLLMAASPRLPRFLAKSTLFKHPLVAPFLRAFRAIPVYRRQDNPAESSKNDETFGECAKALGAGESIAIFPEGRSHSEPHLLELRTGVARIAGAAGRVGPWPKIVPAGLIYSNPSTFRSDVTVVFGSPVDVEPPPSAEVDDQVFVRSLTERVGEALRRITIDAENCEDLYLVESLRGIAAEMEPSIVSAAGNREILLREMLKRYNAVKKAQPEQLARLVAAASEYREVLSDYGLREEDLALDAAAPKAVKHAASRLLFIVLTYPPALYGRLFNFVPYTLTGPLAQMAADEPDTVGTYKLYFGAVLFPAAYTLQFLALSEVAGTGWAAALTALAIPCGLWAESYFQKRNDFFRACRAFFLLLFRGGLKSRLRSKREGVICGLKPFLNLYRI